MTYKNYVIILLLLSLLQNSYSQDSIPKQSTIEFADGKILKGKLSDITSSTEIKLCLSKKKKDCKKYPITEINKITRAPSNFLIKDYKRLLKKNPELKYDKSVIIRKYKVLYTPKKNKPVLARILYTGNNLEFYSYTSISGSSNEYVNELIYITKIDNNIIKYGFVKSKKNYKKNLEKLTEHFKDCDILTKESKQKDAHDKNPLIYFYKLADECEN